MKQEARPDYVYTRLALECMGVGLKYDIVHHPNGGGLKHGKQFPDLDILSKWGK